MEPKKDNPDFDLNAPDLEIFSTTTPGKSPKKKSRLVDQLDKTYVKTSLTLFLLLFLFGSTFFIASRVSNPAFKISSADIGYIPQAQVEIPKSTGVQACSEINYDPGEINFLQTYCQGDICAGQSEKESCEAVDVVVLEESYLSEESGQDGISDCIWVEEETACRPRY